MREIVIGAVVGLVGAAATFGAIELHRDLPAQAVTAAPPAHKVHTSALPMRDGVWGIEKRIATGEE